MKILIFVALCGACISLVAALLIKADSANVSIKCKIYLGSGLPQDTPKDFAATEIFMCNDGSLEFHCADGSHYRYHGQYLIAYTAEAKKP